MTNSSLRRRTVLAMAISALGLAGPARAHANADLVDLTVVDRDTGQPLRPWPHGGRLFVAGQPGARYALRVTNHTGGRVLVVMSVDGVNVLSGETAGYNQRGYIFEPYESYDVSGWRKSDTEVAAFTFAPLPQSYAARTGRPGDVGVIGIAAFREKVAAPIAVAPMPLPMPVAPAYEPRPQALNKPGSLLDELVVGQRAPLQPSAPPAATRAAPTPRMAALVPPAEAAAMAERRDEKLGTAHGAREWSVVTTVAFERATPWPQLIRRIEYDTYDNLVASGVIRPQGYPGHRPQPFPSSPGGGPYVPDPPGRP